jgi:hypothetical protein
MHLELYRSERRWLRRGQSSSIWPKWQDSTFVIAYAHTSGEWWWVINGQTYLEKHQRWVSQLVYAIHLVREPNVDTQALKTKARPNIPKNGFPVMWVSRWVLSTARQIRQTVLDSNSCGRLCMLRILLVFVVKLPLLWFRCLTPSFLSCVGLSSSPQSLIWNQSMPIERHQIKDH